MSLAELIELGKGDSLQEYARQWHGSGKKVLGWTCTYVPEEIIAAADILPVRLFGSSVHAPVLADSYLPTNSCSYCRGCLDLVLKKPAYLDGIVATNSCDDMRRLYDNIAGFVQGLPFKYLLDVPHKDNDGAVEMYRGRLLDFRSEVENWSGRKITEDSLRQAIQLWNKTRKLVRSLYDFRKNDPPSITGSDAMAIMRASMAMPKDEFNVLLESSLTELESRETLRRQPRVLLVGSPSANPREIEVLENAGATVVTDALCTGTRYFWNDVETEKDPFEALARRYIQRIPCPRMLSHKNRVRTRGEQPCLDVKCLPVCSGYTKRPDSIIHDMLALHITDMVEKFKVDGIVYSTLKFCNPWLYRLPAIIEDVQKMTGVPYLRLQREWTLTGGQMMQNRMAAFIETLDWAREPVK